MTEFAKALKAARKRKGWSQTDLASAIGTSRVSIANYETQRQMPTLDKGLQMAIVLGFSLDGLRATLLSPEEIRKANKHEKILKLKRELAKLEGDGDGEA